MLGTNDLLEGVTAWEAAARMEAFLNRCNIPWILLIGLPSMTRGAWVPDDGLVKESKAMARRYEALAAQRGIRFADAGKWDIDLAYDGVHFTEEGHVRFAEGLASCLEVIL
jgi:lysophospholipase L1-like esterase